MGNPFPETSATDLTSGAFKAGHWPFWMLDIGFVNCCIDSKKISDVRDFTKWDSSLGHAPRARIHA
jgi:hypothetical protein